ncbi:hypothetical protein Back11_00970 [Paenibacillus baekrokdamisoli]|uniref:Uncharacterized protein n=1 Tax=Paenibacillus baekrokdamisoli TaxID=1712516 RepID=A0A3G9IKQ2_9BACL|nr:hypothetical protein Back11_00970 [Paenibacillus baekrokdamisoli]
MDDNTLYALLYDGLTSKLENNTHIVWATGGSMVPKENMAEYLNIGRLILHGHA